MTNNNFSDLIIRLTDTWILWMQNNIACKDESLTIKIRKEAAERCEDLNDTRNNIVEELDSFFLS